MVGICYLNIIKTSVALSSLCSIISCLIRDSVGFLRSLNNAGAIAQHRIVLTKEKVVKCVTMILVSLSMWLLRVALSTDSSVR